MKMLKFFIVSFVISLCCANDLLLCTKEFCEKYLDKNTCGKVPDVCKSEEAFFRSVTLPSPVPCNCCNFCLETLEKEASCTVGDASSPTPSSVCGKGLSCKIESGTSGATCQKKNDTLCTLEQHKHDERRLNGNLGHLQIRAKCDRNGMYEPSICVHGEICYCASENGERLFGEVTHVSGTEKPLNCRCSRFVHKASEVLGRPLHPGEYFRCQSNGDYDALQCINDRCFCVESKTGTPEKLDVIVNATEIHTLPCFNNKIHIAGYFKECETLYKQQLKEVHDFEKKGHVVFGHSLINCQLDGEYAPVQETSTTKYCSSPLGQKLEDFEVDKSDSLASEINCKCARSRSYITYAEKPECKKNGNYEPMQCRRNQCRCVDEDGRQIELEVDYNERCSLPCAPTSCK